jgi:alkylation response protein AidB-like acyl-CoA dehydrogenase
MLDESLTPEERAVVERAKSFAAEHVAPNAARWEWERHYPLETIKLACAAGLNTIELARQHGGQGLSFSCKLRAFEEIAKADFAFAFALINHHNACTRSRATARPAQVARLLPRMLTGDLIGCAGLSEPGVGSDFGGLEMAAERVEGGWKLNGAKAWITNAAVAGLSVAYRADRQEPGLSRHRLLRDRGRAAGLSIATSRSNCTAATRSASAASGWSTTSRRTRRCCIRRARLQGGAGRHQRRTRLRRRDVLRHAAGLARDGGALHPAAQDVRPEVIDHQGVRWKLVDAATDLEAARLLTYRAARLIDEGKDAVLPAAHAKKFATDMAVQRIADCIQAMGANGPARDYPLARHLAAPRSPPTPTARSR